jgi:hypothetical protein
MKRPRSHCRNPESGYALLLVYAMAASIAIMLYMQLPRRAFEAQRDQEQMLVDRGEQYTRAIKLYVRKFNRFPADMQALENTQNIRFLRRRYADPLTGKDEWRIIHVGPNGVFVDSLLYGPKKKDDKNAPQTFITEMQQIGGGAANTGGAQGGAGTRTRPSDTPGAPGDPSNPQQGQPGDNSGQPQQNEPTGGPVMVLPDGRIVPATPNGLVPVPGANGTIGIQGGLPGTPGAQPGTQGAQPGTPGGVPGGVPGAPVQTAGGQAGFGTTPGNAGQIAGQTTGTPGSLPPGFQTQANVPAGAANLINQILTTPRPGGLNGTTSTLGTPVGGQPQGQVIGGGIGGVASKVERKGIKVYNDRTDYNEWEFVFDLSKEMRNALPGTQPQTGQQPSSGVQPAATVPSGPISAPGK